MLHRLGSLWWKNTSACVLVFSELISGINDDIVSVLDNIVRVFIPLCECVCMRGVFPGKKNSS